MATVARFKRGRMISESILESGDLMDQPYWVRWLWLGILLKADNSGWIRDHMGLFRNSILSASAPNGARTGPKSPGTGAISTAIELFVRRRMLEPRQLTFISGYQITNWSAGQKLKSYKPSREDEDEDEMKIPPSPPLERGDERGSDSAAPREEPEVPDEVLRFAFDVLRAESDEQTFETLRRLKTRPEDLAGWRAALDEARSMRQIFDPVAYVRRHFLERRTAAETGCFGRPAPKADRDLDSDLAYARAMAAKTAAVKRDAEAARAESAGWRPGEAEMPRFRRTPETPQDANGGAT